MDAADRRAQGTVVLTGATGFVGSVVLERLLMAGDVEVVALVRARDDAAALERLRGTARATWGDADVLRGRVRVLAADLERPGLGLRPEAHEALAAQAGTIVHAAASVSFALPLEEARAINVEGTRRMVELAARARERGLAGRLVHISTAYVHGRTEALGREDGPVGTPEFRNTYEQTKWEAEAVVAALGGATAIVRPSIVVGDSRTGWTSSFNVIYTPLRAVAERVLTYVPASPTSLLDLVAIDQVVDVVAGLVDRPGWTGTVQAVAGDDAPVMQDFANLVCGHLDIPQPARCEPGDAALNGVYAPYADVRGRFELGRALELGMTRVPLEQLVQVMLEYAERSGWRVPDGPDPSLLRPHPTALLRRA